MIKEMRVIITEVKENQNYTGFNQETKLSYPIYSVHKLNKNNWYFIEGSFNNKSVFYINPKIEPKLITKEMAEKPTIIEKIESNIESEGIPAEVIETEPESSFFTDRVESPLESVDRMNSGALIPHQPYLPAITDIDQAIERYNYVKTKLINKGDLHKIGSNHYIKKSGWRKFIRAFGLNIEILHEKGSLTDQIFEESEYNKEKREKKIVPKEIEGWEIKIKVRCSTANGQFVEAIGVCEQFEKSKKRTKADTHATAQTRGINRAVSDLVAFGEVSYEEIA